MVSQSEPQLSPNHYAILVGVNVYNDNPLNGCVNDVKKIKELLDLQDSPRIQTKLFTATDNQAGGIAESAKDRPTYENVRGAIVDVRNNAKAGDYVYIHYSGHGTKIPPAPSDEVRETNGYNGHLALCLLDDNEEGQTKELWGRLFAIQINRMVKNGVIVTVVLDCCFSGALLRGDGDGDREDDAEINDEPEVRYLTYKGNRDEDSEKNDGNDDETLSMLPSLFRGLDMSPGWLIKPEGYTILVACGPHEKASEFELRRGMGEFYGRLSYALYQIFRRHGFSKRHRDIFNHLRSKFHTDPQPGDVGTGDNVKSVPEPKRKRKRQTPILFGDKKQHFFGKLLSVARTRSLDTHDYDTVTLLVDKIAHDEPLILRAGQAHGLCTGDKLDIFPSRLGEQSQSLHGAVLVATIQQANGLTSVLDLKGSDASASDSWEGEIRSRNQLYDFPVYLDPNLKAVGDVEECLKGRFLHVHEDSTQPYAFHLKVGRPKLTDTEDHFIILDGNWNSLANIPPLPLSQTDAQDVADVLAHLAKYMLVKNLKNPSASKQNGHKGSNNFRSLFDLFVRTRSGDQYQPGELIKLQEENAKGKAWTFEINFTNNSESNLFVYIYCMSPLWDIDHIQYASFDVVPSSAVAKAAGEPSEIKYEPMVRKKLHTTVFDQMRLHNSYSDDIVKVIVTSRPTLFDILEQDEVGKMLDYRRKGHYREAHVQELLAMEEWDIFSFTIRTIFRKQGLE